MPQTVHATIHQNTDGTWPDRPTPDADKVVVWMGRGPFPPIIIEGTAGMLSGSDLQFRAAP